ncbi:MAG: primosomal replication protein PriC [Colwellia sp.]
MAPPKHQLAIRRLSTLLNHLYEQAKHTDQKNSKQKSHRLIENNNLFSPHLFTTQSDSISLYVEEVKTRLNQFSRLCDFSADNTKKTEFAKSSLAHIEQQISALMNALQANQSMHQAAQVSFNAKKKVRAKSFQATKLRQSEKYTKMAKSILLSSQQLYQQLDEHKEFESRLMTMITEREQQRVRARSTAGNDALLQEVLALHQRLGRCRKALSAIERKIKLAEKRGT